MLAISLVNPVRDHFSMGVSLLHGVEPPFLLKVINQDVVEGVSFFDFPDVVASSSKCYKVVPP